jgi:triacylglycerol esterase/lipase EstA (alpha/beta hydrolase family)
VFDPSSGTSSGTSADDTIPVDYGEDFRQFDVDPRGQIQKAVLYGKLSREWKWSNNTPVHFICHSQGGNTIRLLIELLKDTHSRPENFGTTELDRAIKSCTTLGTPHMGTTVTNVVEVSADIS